MVGAHEEIVQRELVAGGAAQADRVPDVGPLHVLGAHQHGALLLQRRWRRVCGEPSAVEDRAMRAEPGRVPAAGGEGPDAGHPVAALAFDRPDLGAGTPGQHRARIAEDRARHRQVEIGRRHRAAAGLAQAPGGRRIGPGDGLDDVEEGDGIGFDPVRSSAAAAGETAAPRAACRAAPAAAGACSRSRSEAAATSGRTASARAITAGSPARSAEVAIIVSKFHARRTVAAAADCSTSAASSLSICSIDLRRVSIPGNNIPLRPSRTSRRDGQRSCRSAQLRAVTIVIFREPEAAAPCAGSPMRNAIEPNYLRFCASLRGTAAKTEFKADIDGRKAKASANRH